ncbi:ras family-domain-containing protein [Mycena vulgaris]|nr:ras family-domain-containing protein [Mycena vulgaris]
MRALPPYNSPLPNEGPTTPRADCAGNDAKLDGRAGSSLPVEQCYDPKIEESFTKQTVVDEKICVVKLQDTAWQEDWGAGVYRHWAELTVRRESDACMLVFSITCRGSFGSTARFHEQVKALKEGDLLFLLIGNKSDLSDNREVSKEEGTALAKQFG